MSEISHLTIRGFIKAGMNFQTKVHEWRFISNQSSSWSAVTRIEKPLIITRRTDQHSIRFAQLRFQRAQDNPIKFSEATLTVDETGRTGSLLKRVIYDFLDLEVISYNLLGKFESIYFDFAKASVFEASVEKLMGP